METKVKKTSQVWIISVLSIVLIAMLVIHLLNMSSKNDTITKLKTEKVYNDSIFEKRIDNLRTKLSNKTEELKDMTDYKNSWYARSGNLEKIVDSLFWACKEKDSLLLLAVKKPVISKKSEIKATGGKGKKIKL